jgi:predicted nuclease of predicted toxin-antitoxin system
MKFLVDVGVGRAVEQLLRDSGHDVRAVRDIDPHARDSEILRIAVAESLMVVTMDKDFGGVPLRTVACRGADPAA